MIYDCWTGKPIGELEHPGITICSHGWIQEVIDSVIEYQKSEFAKENNIGVSDEAFEKPVLTIIDTLYCYRTI